MERIRVFKCWFLVSTCISVVVAVLSGCDGRATEETADQLSLRVLSARTHLEEAWLLARQWRNDVELKQIQADILAPAQTGQPLVSFDFESPSEDQLVYGVICFSDTCLGQEFPVSRLTGHGSIKFDDEMIDSIQAATIGHQNGGDQFAEMGDARMSVRLGRDKPRDVGPTVWQAYYVDLRGNGPLYVVIDPYTGEVIRLE